MTSNYKHWKNYKRKLIKHQIESGTKLDTEQQKEFEAFEKLSKLNKTELDQLGKGLDDAINHYKYKTGKKLN